MRFLTQIAVLIFALTLPVLAQNMDHGYFENIIFEDSAWSLKVNGRRVWNRQKPYSYSNRCAGD